MFSSHECRPLRSRKRDSPVDVIHYCLGLPLRQIQFLAVMPFVRTHLSQRRPLLVSILSASILDCHLQKGNVTAALFVRRVKHLPAAGLACGRPVHGTGLELPSWKKNKLLEVDLEKNFFFLILGRFQ